MTSHTDAVAPSAAMDLAPGQWLIASGRRGSSTAGQPRLRFTCSLGEADGFCPGGVPVGHSHRLRLARLTPEAAQA